MPPSRISLSRPMPARSRPVPSVAPTASPNTISSSVLKSCLVKTPFTAASSKLPERAQLLVGREFVDRVVDLLVDGSPIGRLDLESNLHLVRRCDLRNLEEHRPFVGR